MGAVFSAPFLLQVTQAHGALAHTKAEVDEWQQERQRLVQVWGWAGQGCM